MSLKVGSAPVIAPVSTKAVETPAQPAVARPDDLFVPFRPGPFPIVPIYPPGGGGGGVPLNRILLAERDLREAAADKTAGAAARTQGKTDAASARADFKQGRADLTDARSLGREANGQRAEARADVQAAEQAIAQGNLPGAIKDLQAAQAAEQKAGSLDAQAKAKVSSAITDFQAGKGERTKARGEFETARTDDQRAAGLEQEAIRLLEGGPTPIPVDPPRLPFPVDPRIPTPIAE